MNELARSLSLPSAIFVIVGYIIGATIYILPGALAPTVGPAVFIAYGLAAIPALVASFVMAQVGAALPVTGALYVLLRDSIGPLAGFFYLWIMVALGAVVIPLVAFGFAEYAVHFLPGMEARRVALLLTLLFVGLNCLGLAVTTIVQGILVVGFLVALLVFGVGGVVLGDSANLVPLLPNGVKPLVIATITAYFSYTGVFVIAEIAGEIRSPGRNIPLAVGISFLVVTAVYVLVPLALVMLEPWQDMGGAEASLVSAAQHRFPGPVVNLVAAGALLAAATSVNGILLGLSRDFYQGACSGEFPRAFATVREGTGVPVNSVLLVGGLATAGVLAGARVTDYAQVALMGLMIVQALTGVALWRMPSAMPGVLARADFRLGPRVLKAIAVVYIALSLAFLAFLAREQQMAIALGCLYLIGGFGYFRWRTRTRP